MLLTPARQPCSLIDLFLAAAAACHPILHTVLCALCLCPGLARILQKRLAGEFSEAMGGSIAELECDMQGGSGAQKDLAKQRRLQLREVLKAVTDLSISIEERLRFLQASTV
jgi:hypothetical protein